MLPSSLHNPNDDATRSEHGYSTAVAGALVRAYTWLKCKPECPDLYVRAARCLERYKDFRFSDRQRMRVYFVLAMGHSATGAVPLALSCVDESLDAALMVDDIGATVELAYLRGTLHASLLQYEEALADHGYCIEQLDLLGQDRMTADPPLQLQLYTDLAFYSHALAQLDTGHRWLDLAGELIPHVQSSELSKANTSWARALLYRWASQPERALPHALAAEAIYAKQPSSPSHPRIQTVVGDLALDLAESFPRDHAPRARDAWTVMAHPFLRDTARQARESGDAMGAAQAILALVRYERIASVTSDRLTIIHDVLATGNQLGDIALLSQAYTALGQELTSQGLIEQGLNCFRETLNVLAGSDLPIMGVAARRALLQSAEFREE